MCNDVINSRIFICSSSSIGVGAGINGPWPTVRPIYCTYTNANLKNAGFNQKIFLQIRIAQIYFRNNARCSPSDRLIHSQFRFDWLGYINFRTCFGHFGSQAKEFSYWLTKGLILGKLFWGYLGWSFRKGLSFPWQYKGLKYSQSI